MSSSANSMRLALRRFGITQPRCAYDLHWPRTLDCRWSGCRPYKSARRPLTPLSPQPNHLLASASWMKAPQARYQRGHQFPRDSSRKRRNSVRMEFRRPCHWRNCHHRRRPARCRRNPYPGPGLRSSPPAGASERPSSMVRVELKPCSTTSVEYRSLAALILPFAGLQLTFEIDF